MGSLFIYLINLSGFFVKDSLKMLCNKLKIGGERINVNENLGPLETRVR